jgi:hypothetical protein
MTRPAGLDPLEDLLSRPAPLEGAEFTAAVVRRLPARRRSSRSWILGIGAALATGAAAALVALGATGLGPALLALIDGKVPEGAGLMALLALAALGGTAAGVVVPEAGSGEEAAAG